MYTESSVQIKKQITCQVSKEISCQADTEKQDKAKEQINKQIKEQTVNKPNKQVNSKISDQAKVNIYLSKCLNYNDENLLFAKIFELLQNLDLGNLHSSKILIKPNLLRSHILTCSSAAVIESVGLFFLEQGAKVVVADSPGFGTIKKVAEFIGLSKRLAKHNIPLLSLDQGVRLKLKSGYVSLSKNALESDLILSLPRLKAHQHMGITCVVKNIFGCIPGLKKAMYHAKFGKSHTQFANLILDIFERLPPVAGLVDAITAMHKTGPSAGEAYPLELLAASTSGLALDTAVYSLLGAAPQEIPLWQEALNRQNPHAHPASLNWCLTSPHEFKAENFIIPNLNSPDFNPLFLLKSNFKRLFARIIK